jgi:ABC-2 type transport system ATP-binding protein
MLSIKKFTKSYGGNPVLSIEKLELDPGLYWIQGDNGSGKTTLFKSLAGLLPCQGNVSFSGGIQLHRTPVAYRRLVNYAEAEPLYPGFLTGRDLLHFVGSAKKASSQQMSSLMKALGVGSYANNPCDTYSSGMLKKLSLALAFLGSPRLILLDEPIITLDESARNVLFGLVREFLNRKDTIMLLSSHQDIRHDLSITGTFVIRNKTLESV